MGNVFCVFVVQCVAMCCGVLQFVPTHDSVLGVFVCSSVLQCVAVCCCVTWFCSRRVFVCASLLTHTHTIIFSPCVE